MGTTEKRTRGLDGLIFRFQETMAGYLGLGDTDPRSGSSLGRDQNTPLQFDVQINIVDLGRFLRVAEHDAELSGTVTFRPLGGMFPIREGRFNLFTVLPQSGIRQMKYTFCFTAGDGQTYFLHGHKEIHDDKGALDVIPDMTTLFTKIHIGKDDQATVYGAGELHFDIKDAPALVASMEVEGASAWSQKLAAYVAFSSFAYGALRDEYLKFPAFYTTHETRTSFSPAACRRVTIRRFRSSSSPAFTIAAFPGATASSSGISCSSSVTGRGGISGTALPIACWKGSNWMLLEASTVIAGRFLRLSTGAPPPSPRCVKNHQTSLHYRWSSRSTLRRALTTLWRCLFPWYQSWFAGSPRTWQRSSAISCPAKILSGSSSRPTRLR